MMKILKAASPHFNERTLLLDSILIHYTDMSDAEETLAWLCHLQSQVSAHYLVDEKGKIFHLVPEEKRAWHAGESYWQGCTDLNSCSIGIELANSGHSHGYQPFPETQVEALMRLCQDLKARWGIPSSRILGHSDVAPRRKQDPGHLFPWETLAREGLGLWPSGNTPHQESDVREALTTIGYETISLSHTLLAFQRHFQPHKVDGVADEETRRLLMGLMV
jgi:N-acetylmuramoyl-L-alanine amidase